MVYFTKYITFAWLTDSLYTQENTFVYEEKFFSLQKIIKMH